jgi:ParB family chromosome partitioning protein
MEGKYEIITGQRRFLAHRELNLPSIMATVIDHRISETDAKVFSLTENLVRRDLNQRDLIDACTFLFKRYGSVSAVVEETGLPRGKVQQYVKYDRLAPLLKKLVDAGDIKMDLALKVQDAASAAGSFNESEAQKLVQEMRPMTDPQRRQIVKEKIADPTTSVDDVIEAAKSGRIYQTIINLGPVEHRGLQEFAKSEGATQDNAAVDLIREGLSSKGYMGSEEA